MNDEQLHCRSNGEFFVEKRAGDDPSCWRVNLYAYIALPALR